MALKFNFQMCLIATFSDVLITWFTVKTPLDHLITSWSRLQMHLLMAWKWLPLDRGLQRAFSLEKTTKSSIKFNRLHKHLLKKLLPQDLDIFVFSYSCWNYEDSVICWSGFWWHVFVKHRSIVAHTTKNSCCSLLKTNKYKKFYYCHNTFVEILYSC